MTKFKQLLLVVLAFAASWLPDALIVGGGCAVAFGAGMVYPPAGWIVGGVLLMVEGWLAARSAR